MEHLNDFILKNILRSDYSDYVLSFEDNEVEYKKILDWSNKESRIKYLKELAALSNAGGGYLIFGVDDISGFILGLKDPKEIDLAQIMDMFQSYFSPSIDIRAQRYKHNEKDLFVIYANKFEHIPTICKKSSHEIVDGRLYWRYSGKSEEIKGNDLINLLQELNSSNNATKELVELKERHRKKDLMPEFESRGCSTNPDRFSINLLNIGERAKIIDIQELEDNYGYFDQSSKRSIYIEKNQEHTLYGRYKESGLPNNKRILHFRLIFQDRDENKYYQEFKTEASKLIIIKKITEL